MKKLLGGLQSTFSASWGVLKKKPMRSNLSRGHFQIQFVSVEFMLYLYIFDHMYIYIYTHTYIMWYTNLGTCKQNSEIFDQAVDKPVAIMANQPTPPNVPPSEIWV